MNSVVRTQEYPIDLRRRPKNLTPALSGKAAERLCREFAIQLLGQEPVALALRVAWFKILIGLKRRWIGLIFAGRPFCPQGPCPTAVAECHQTEPGVPHEGL